MIIAIDGPAGAGKSTVAKGVAKRLGFGFLDTGAMYRAVTLGVIQRGHMPLDAEACCAVARESELAFDSSGRITINGIACEPDIRGETVTRNVSAVSAHPGVRDIVVERQRVLARERGDVVVEGRDTTTVVFPEADLKFFLIASPRERARRRAAQLDQVDRVDEIQRDIERRDQLDTTRACAPLRQADDATVIDTDGLGVEEVVDEIARHVEGRVSRG